MRPEELAADRAVCDAATPGPWERGQYQPGIVTTQYQIVGVRACDVPFIAAARTRWPAALDEIEQLKTALEAALDDVDGLVADYAAALDRSEKLQKENAALREQVSGHAERIAKQSELLSRRAEK